MDVPAWCGTCGQRFGLAEALNPPRVGSCPRCGTAFGAGYAPVTVVAIRQVAAAAQALDAGAAQLGTVAPRLHLDLRALLAELAARPDA